MRVAFKPCTLDEVLRCRRRRPREKLALKCDEFFDGQLGVQRSCWADALAACAERLGFQLLCSAGQVTFL